MFEVEIYGDNNTPDSVYVYVKLSRYIYNGDEQITFET